MRESNIPLRTLAERLALSELCDLERTLNARVALSKKASDRNELIVAQYGANSGSPVAPLLLTYGELILAHESISAKNLPRQFEQAATSTSFDVLNGFPVEVNNTASIELVASEDPQSRPKYMIELATRNRGHLNSAGPLVVYGQPAFETVEQAVRAWVPLRPFHGSSDGRLGSILIEVPLAGPRLGTLNLESEGSLRVAVEGRSDAIPIELSGIWHSSDGNLVETFAHPITGDSVVVARPSIADQVAMWLVRGDSLVTDFFIENPHRCTRKQRILFPQHATAAEGDPAVQIDAGEGETTEWKPFLKLTSEKVDEVVRTVVAFANTRGGTIFIGVSDYGEVDGIDKELWDATPRDKRKSLDECAKNYCAEVRKKVLDRVSTMTGVQADIIRVRGKLVARIRVEEARRKPCSDVIRNEFWIRKGSNTRRPDTEQLRGLMAERNSFPGAFD